MSQLAGVNNVQPTVGMFTFDISLLIRNYYISKWLRFSINWWHFCLGSQGESPPQKNVCIPLMQGLHFFSKFWPVGQIRPASSVDLAHSGLSVLTLNLACVLLKPNAQWAH